MSGKIFLTALTLVQHMKNILSVLCTVEFGTVEFTSFLSYFRDTVGGSVEY